VACPEGSEDFRSMLLEELDHALGPTVHEQQATSSGTILEPRSDPATWAAGTDLQILRTPLRQPTLAASRRFINGLSSWLLRRDDEAESEWVLFDRPARLRTRLGHPGRRVGRHHRPAPSLRGGLHRRSVRGAALAGVHLESRAARRCLDR
jgi:hypothetical protein